jgi:hypothetical protein
VRTWTITRRPRLALAWVVAFAGIASAALAQGWTTYVNARFGTVADIPAHGFTADAAAENADGQAWTSVDGLGRISVYGSFMVVADTTAEYRRFSLEAARGEGIEVTYDAGRGNWFAWSGTIAGDIVYMKAVVTQHCGSAVAHHVHLRYPAAQQGIYAPIVKRMSAGLRGPRDAACR